VSKVSEWYQGGFRALWKHLRTTLGVKSQGQRKLESAAAYCRTQYIGELTQEHGADEAQRILDREKPI
jgi:hypothetical protein